MKWFCSIILCILPQFVRERYLPVHSWFESVKIPPYMYRSSCCSLIKCCTVNSYKKKCRGLTITAPGDEEWTVSFLHSETTELNDITRSIEGTVRSLQCNCRHYISNEDAISFKRSSICLCLRCRLRLDNGEVLNLDLKLRYCTGLQSTSAN